MLARKIITLLMISFVILGFSSPTCNALYQLDSSAVSVEAPQWEKDQQGLLLLTGLIQNVSAKELDTVSIRCVFFDNKNIQIGNGIDNIMDLKIGGIAKYKFFAPGGAVNAQITDVKVFAK